MNQQTNVKNTNQSVNFKMVYSKLNVQLKIIVENLIFKSSFTNYDFFKRK